MQEPSVSTLQTTPREHSNMFPSACWTWAVATRSYKQAAVFSHVCSIAFGADSAFFQTSTEVFVLL